MSDKLKIGWIGVGAAGGKIVDQFAKQYSVLAINTSDTDFNLENISEDNKILTKVTSGGGAGGNIKLGMKAISIYREKIQKKINLTMKDADFIYVVCGLGGGSGSLGAISVIKLLANMKKQSGLVCTLPEKAYSTDGKVNSYFSIREIFNTNRSNPYFKSCMIISNEELFKTVLKDDNVDQGEVHKKANSILFKRFNPIYKFSHKASEEAVDPQDLLNVFKTKGCMIMSYGEYNLENKENISLANKVDDLLEEPIFVVDDPSQATDVVVVIERPSIKDAKQVREMKLMLKERIGNNVRVGIYPNDNIDKIRVFLTIAGLPFPAKALKRLEEEAKTEYQAKKEKEEARNEDIFEWDVDEALDYIEEDKTEEEDYFKFSIFELDEDDIEEESEIVVDEDEENIDFNLEEDEDDKKNGFFNLG